MKKVFGVLLLCVAVAAQGASFKKVVGQSFPTVKVKDVLSGEEIDLSKVLAKDGVKGAVVFFTSTKCPVAVAYEERINQLVTKYAASVPFLALNANSSEDAASQTTYAKEKGFKFHVAMDKGSKIAKEIGASCTPEFYLIDKSGKVVFHGPLDDSQDTTQITKHFLAGALEAVLAGKAIAAEDQEVQAFGCGIKFPKEDKTAKADHGAHGAREKAGDKHDHGHDQSHDHSKEK